MAFQSGSIVDAALTMSVKISFVQAAPRFEGSFDSGSLLPLTNLLRLPLSLDVDCSFVPRV